MSTSTSLTDAIATPLSPPHTAPPDAITTSPPQSCRNSLSHSSHPPPSPMDTHTESLQDGYCAASLPFCPVAAGRCCPSHCRCVPLVTNSCDRSLAPSPVQLQPPGTDVSRIWCWCRNNGSWIHNIQVLGSVRSPPSPCSLAPPPPSSMFYFVTIITDAVAPELLLFFHRQLPNLLHEMTYLPFTWARRSYAAALGVRRARLQGGWARTEQIKGVYNFSWLDEAVFGLDQAGIRPWLQISYGNTLYGPAAGDSSAGSCLPRIWDPGYPEVARAWTSWVNATVRRYKNVTDTWEVWNVRACERVTKRPVCALLCGQWALQLEYTCSSLPPACGFVVMLFLLCSDPPAGGVLVLKRSPMCKSCHQGTTPS